MKKLKTFIQITSAFECVNCKFAKFTKERSVTRELTIRQIFQ